MSRGRPSLLGVGIGFGAASAAGALGAAGLVADRLRRREDATLPEYATLLEPPSAELLAFSDDGVPLHVLVVPWRFPNEHQRCRRITRAKHHLCAPSMQVAFATIMHGGSKPRQTYGRLGVYRCSLGGQHSS